MRRVRTPELTWLHQATISLPNNSPLARVVGPAVAARGEAKQAAALYALAALHQRGALDDHLRSALPRAKAQQAACGCPPGC